MHTISNTLSYAEKLDKPAPQILAGAEYRKHGTLKSQQAECSLEKAGKKRNRSLTVSAHIQGVHIDVSTSTEIFPHARAADHPLSHSSCVQLNPRDVSWAVIEVAIKLLVLHNDHVQGQEKDNFHWHSFGWQNCPRLSVKGLHLLVWSAYIPKTQRVLSKQFAAFLMLSVLKLSSNWIETVQAVCCNPNAFCAQTQNWDSLSVWRSSPSA